MDSLLSEFVPLILKTMCFRHWWVCNSCGS
ncbi:hypothetical protein E1A91_A09G033700v1 [Gossypium mustelinum]|uniref:Uncharacterized protein n=1 Tax=Gossypium mustelinum TaxID=34275 RepID=A0A5D2XTH9_GOSMU|nr:hypothetical protein E1A91_A09G033700v1 [Gossypium mustelinum]